MSEMQVGRIEFAPEAIWHKAWRHDTDKLKAERDEARRQLAEARARLSALDARCSSPGVSIIAEDYIDNCAAWIEKYKERGEKSKRQLAEAAEAVRLLLDVLRKAGPPPEQMPWDRLQGKPEAPAVIAYRALPAWMRKEIER